MKWFHFTKYELGDNSAWYLFCYIMFAFNSSSEEKAELKQLRRQFNGDNQQALSCMFVRLMDRYNKNEYAIEREKVLAQREVKEIQNNPYKEEYKAEYRRYKQRGLSEEDIILHQTVVKGKLEDKILEMFNEPILSVIQANKFISYEIHDKIYGCYTVVFNDVIHTGYDRPYQRYLHLDDIDVWINDEIRFYTQIAKKHVERMKQAQKLQEEHNRIQAKLRPALDKRKEWQERYDYVQDIIKSTEPSHRKTNKQLFHEELRSTIVDHVREALGQANTQQNRTNRRNNNDVNIFDEQIF